MKKLGVKAIFPGPNTSKRNHAEMVYPYLLKTYLVTKLNQVWQIDITYIRVNSGFMYLAGITDIYSRVIVGWKLSSCIDTELVISALEDAIFRYGVPEIINSDQGFQFTSKAWLSKLQEYNIKISMTGKIK